MGIKTILTKNSIKIYGNPNLEIKKITINNFLKDHRVFMTSVIAALVFGGKWKIFDKEVSIHLFQHLLIKLKVLVLVSIK